MQMKSEYTNSDSQDKRDSYNRLYDIYGMLLTEKQVTYFTMRYHEDLSLREIAEIMNVTPQAVVDQLKRTTTLLDKYEQKMGLCFKQDARHELLEQAIQILQNINSTQNQSKKELNQLVKILEDLQV